MMYRPGWLGPDCQGTTLALERSPNKQFVTLGSEDGYMFVYSSETGLPMGTTKPSTTHTSEVSFFQVTFMHYNGFSLLV